MARPKPEYPTVTSPTFETGLSVAQVDAFMAQVKARLPAGRVRIGVQNDHEAGDETFADRYYLEARVTPPPQPKDEVRSVRSVALPEGMQRHLQARYFRENAAAVEILYASLLKINRWSEEKILRHPDFPKENLVPQKRKAGDTPSASTVYIPARLDRTINHLAGLLKSPVEGVRCRVFGLALFLDQPPEKPARKRAASAPKAAIKKKAIVRTRVG